MRLATLLSLLIALTDSVFQLPLPEPFYVIGYILQQRIFNSLCHCPYGVLYIVLLHHSQVQLPLHTSEAFLHR